jgi:hypothetical protein
MAIADLLPLAGKSIPKRLDLPIPTRRPPLPLGTGQSHLLEYVLKVHTTVSSAVYLSVSVGYVVSFFIAKSSTD